VRGMSRASDVSLEVTVRKVSWREPPSSQDVGPMGGVLGVLVVLLLYRLSCCLPDL